LDCVLLPEIALSEMLSKLLVAYTIEYDNEFEHAIPHRTAMFGEGGPEPTATDSGEPVRRLWQASLAMWSNFMRYVPPDGVPVAQIDQLPANRPGLERWGYITVTPEGLVKATRAGRYAQAAWRRLDGAIDRRWADRFGPEVIGDLTESLWLIAGQVGAGMPLYLPMVSYADGLRSKYRDLRELGLPEPGLPEPGLPEPGLPEPGRTELGLSALLSQVLLAFTMDYEREAKLPLPTCANTLRVVSDDGMRVSDIPHRAGVSKEGVASTVGFLERHGYLETGPDPSGRSGKFAWPTPRGVKARDGRVRLCAKIEQAWHDRFGAAEINSLKASLENLLHAAADGEPVLAQGLKGYPDGWRNRAPYLAQTRAVLANPAEHLPSQPMVLHRGGYPDGS
jgi:DNA-binding MarR family transcriptional regulator